MASETMLKAPRPTQPMRLARLIAMKEEVQDRLSRVEADRRRQAKPPESDAQERAIEFENDEVLDRLSESLNVQLTDILTAIRRIEVGIGNRCAVCGRRIDERRILVLPQATRCRRCA